MELQHFSIFTCMQPFQKNHEGNIYTLPCGKCVYCYKKRISNWSFRLMEQDKISSCSYFITLTYSPEHCPMSKNGFMTLKKDDLQKFFKRLRKHNEIGLKYYACGEYGSKTKRPHYHIIMFNVNSDSIEKAWKLGQVHFGQVNEASVGYTLKYMVKGSDDFWHKNDDRQRIFSLMSKGLGKNYLTPQMLNWHKADLINRVYCNLKDGKKISMPRYYKEKVYTKDEKGDIKAHFTDLARRKLENMSMDENTPRRVDLIKQHNNNLTILQNQKKQQRHAV